MRIVKTPKQLKKNIIRLSANTYKEDVSGLNDTICRPSEKFPSMEMVKSPRSN
jgi:hypothetical protein